MANSNTFIYISFKRWMFIQICDTCGCSSIWLEVRHPLCLMLRNPSIIEASTYGNPSALCEKIIFVQVWASFQSVIVTRPVVTDGTARYRMKSMGITFPLILTHTPLSFLWVKLFGYYSHSKASNFSKSWKCWNLTNSAQRRNSTFWTLFFKWLLLGVYKWH